MNKQDIKKYTRLLIAQHYFNKGEDQMGFYALFMLEADL